MAHQHAAALLASSSPRGHAARTRVSTRTPWDRTWPSRCGTRCGITCNSDSPPLLPPRFTPEHGWGRKVRATRKRRVVYSRDGARRRDSQHRSRSSSRSSSRLKFPRSLLVTLPAKEKRVKFGNGLGSSVPVSFKKGTKILWP